MSFGDNAIGRTAVFKWVQRFQTGRQSLEDDPRSGRPTTSGGTDNVKVIEEVVSGDRCLTVREIACVTGISKCTITNELQMRKLTARWVPRLLSDVHKENRVVACQQLQQMVEDRGEAFWSRIITVDETWFPFYLPETKEQSKQCCRVGEKPPLKAKTVPSAGKVMIAVFGTVMGSFSLITYQRELPSTAHTTQTCFRRISARLSRTNGEENCLHHRYCNMTTPVPIQQR